MLISNTFLLSKMLIICDYRNEFCYFGVHYAKKKSGYFNKKLD